MKKTIICTTILLLSLFSTFTISAQNNNISNTERQRWLNEMRSYKREFLTKELDLNKDQQNAFFPIYEDMDNEIERLNAQTRELETSVSENADATDLELENAARTIFELKRAEGQIEMTYFDKFKEILTPRQLLLLKNAERKFTQQLVNHHRRMRRNNDNR